MKIVLFGDEESAILFNILGIEGVIYGEDRTGTEEAPDKTLRGAGISEITTSELEWKKSFEEIFDQLLEDPEIGIIIITEKLLIKHRDYIIPIKMERRLPIIIEIPGMLEEIHEDFAREMVRRVIGIDFGKV